MMRSGYRQEHKPRWKIAAVVLLIHVVVIAGLVRAFTPDLAAQVARSVTRAFTIAAEPPPPPAPVPSSAPSSAAPREEGAAAAAGRKADPRPVPAPRTPVVVRPAQAPPVAGKGAENAAGATVQGEGTGASGFGSGTGAGAGGDGTGGGGASPTVKVAGDINSAKDYPRATRDLRVGASVTIDLRVGTDGRVAACRIVQPSPDPEADRITCDLAMRRFRFRPAKDTGGKTVEAIYRWRQRWFY
ncbi:TonB-like protein [Novosphingobium resinovorum]|jgi:protein TonB|uniref:TonB-like protein n=1 Tax=Novosphingobium resinovorum TaxID=158500 RepID=A0A031K338_9SPHN|nr:TonB family protein [Novosphingobium resinovorum]EZP83639.1 TonB-like protein [Novosphingobium resinovorum]